MTAPQSGLTWDASKRYKMAAVERPYNQYTIYFSADGVHWRKGPTSSGQIRDRSTIFLNPMRKPRQWVYSIRWDLGGPAVKGPFGRSRSYWETEELGVGASRARRSGNGVVASGAIITADCSAALAGVAVLVRSVGAGERPPTLTAVCRVTRSRCAHNGREAYGVSQACRQVVAGSR